MKKKHNKFEKIIKNPAEELIKQKAKKYKKAIQQFLEREALIRKNFNNSIPLEETKKVLLSPISTKVWLFKDGGAIVRFWDWRGNENFESTIMNISTEEWANIYKSIPTLKGELNISHVIKGIGNTEFFNCGFNDYIIPYANISFIKYDDPRLENPEQMAILDFRLTAIGQILNIQENKSTNTIQRKTIIETLNNLINQFQKLLNASDKEEELQVFLKNNPILLSPTTKIIPKQKLGEDFITDFVLINSTGNGNEYCLVEIEKVNKKLFNKDDTPTADLTQAESQTIDWELWLEKNKAYLQNKLPGFESPKFLIIIGKSTNLSDNAKGKLRVMNRRLNNLKIQTYDDLLIKNQELLEALKPLGN